MDEKPLKAAAVPCGSCPYRKDVPSGIWSKHEYDKLPDYDGPTWGQCMALFLCHQRDGNLCAGWLACHNPRELLALRLPFQNVDPSVFQYTTREPVFESGAAAREHGIRDIPTPGVKAQKMVSGLIRKGKVKPNGKARKLRKRSGKG